MSASKLFLLIKSKTFQSTRDVEYWLFCFLIEIKKTPINFLQLSINLMKRKFL